MQPSMPPPAASFAAETLSRCFERMQRLPCFITWNHMANNYIGFLEDAARCETEKAHRDHYRVLADMVNYSSLHMRQRGFKIENAEFAFIVANLKPKRCTACYQRFKSRVKCLNGNCVLTKDYRRYRFPKSTASTSACSAATNTKSRRKWPSTTSRTTSATLCS